MMLFSILGLILMTTIFCNALPSSPAESSDTTPKTTNNDDAVSDVADRAQVNAIAADFRDNQGLSDFFNSGSQGFVFIINEYKANNILRTSVCNTLRWGWKDRKSDISEDKTVTCHRIPGPPPLSDLISVDSERFIESEHNLHVIEQPRKFTWRITDHLDEYEETFKITCSLPEFTAFDTVSCTVESDGVISDPISLPESGWSFDHAGHLNFQGRWLPLSEGWGNIVPFKGKDI